MSQVDVAALCKDARTRLGMDQAEFAKHMGVNRQATVSHWENGKNTPSAAIIERMQGIVATLSDIRPALDHYRARLKQTVSGLADAMSLSELEQVAQFAKSIIAAQVATAAVDAGQQEGVDAPPLAGPALDGMKKRKPDREQTG